MSRIIKSFNVCVGDTAKVEAPTLNLDTMNNESLESEMECISGSATDEEVMKRAEAIIKKAKAEAKTIIDEAMVKIEEEREIVLEQARKNGFEEGYNQAMSQCEDIIQESGLIKKKAIEETDAFLSGIEEEVVDIIMDIARKIVEVELSINREDILYLVKNALEGCLHKDYILLKVSKEDYQYVEESKNKLLAMVQGIGEIEIKLDHTLKTGSCILETPFGAVDGSAGTRLNEIEKVFKGLIGKE